MRHHDAAVGAIAKQQELKVIVSGLLAYGSMGCLALTAWCSSAMQSDLFTSDASG
jgi:hypothetical protein